MNSPRKFGLKKNGSVLYQGLKWKTPMVFPKPASTWEGAIRTGETRVNGSLVIDSPAKFEELNDDDEFVRDGKDEELECEGDEDDEGDFV